VAAVAYARQVAAPGASFVERFARGFNYPARSQLRGLADWDRYGSYTRFCSNACAAWASAALDEIGGFPETLVSEETIAASRLLERGHRIAYVAEAVVEHTHRQSLGDEFRRHFDIGWTRRTFAQDLLSREGDSVRGRGFAVALLARAAREAPWLVPRLALVVGAKWAGYTVGCRATGLSPGIARHLSGQDFFWRSRERAGSDRDDRLSPARI
jgi:rhamnosyltransferase